MRIGDFERAGLRFEVDDEGPLDGPLVVLLHGFPTDRSSWRRVAPLLHDAGLRTIAPDQRGYSSGARPRGRAAYTSDQLVADVVALADAAGAGRFHVVGHDWGGGVAWLTAGQHADRVASVTSLSTPHPIATNRALRTSLDQARRSWYMAAIQLPRVPEWWFAPRMARTLAADGLPAEDAQRYAAHLAEPGALTAAMNWYRGALLTRGVAHRCRVPAAFVWGERDSYLGPKAAALTAECVLADYRFTRLPHGHWLPELAPRECAAAILDRVTSAGEGSAS